MIRKTILIIILVVFISGCIGDTDSQVEKDRLSDFSIKYSDDIPNEIYNHLTNYSNDSVDYETINTRKLFINLTKIQNIYSYKQLNDNNYIFQGRYKFSTQKSLSNGNGLYAIKYNTTGNLSVGQIYNIAPPERAVGRIHEKDDGKITTGPFGGVSTKEIAAFYPGLGISEDSPETFTIEQNGEICDIIHLDKLEKLRRANTKYNNYPELSCSDIEPIDNVNFTVYNRGVFTDKNNYLPMNISPKSKIHSLKPIGKVDNETEYNITKLSNGNLVIQSPSLTKYNKFRLGLKIKDEYNEKSLFTKDAKLNDGRVTKLKLAKILKSKDKRYVFENNITKITLIGYKNKNWKTLAEKIK